MATADDETSPDESGADEERPSKRPFQPEIYEEPQNVSHEAGQNNSTEASALSTHQGGNFASIFVTFGKPELEQMLKQMTFTRSETQHLIALLHSRTIQESSTPLLRLEASTTRSGSMEIHKDGDERDELHASVVISRAIEEGTASPAELANVYKCSTSSTRLSKTLMASPQHPATMENLPEELLSNIFIRLLSKQLAQMRSVSKSWNDLLSRSSFIRSHLSRSIQINDEILLVFHGSSDSKPFTTHSCRSPRLELTNFIQLPENRQYDYANRIKVIGCVNGLICSSYGDSVIHIWNPSLSAVLTLPPYSMPSGDGELIRNFFGFGFDPKTDDYKVVKLTGLIGQYINDIKWWLEVEIFSMRKGSWELVTQRFPSHILIISKDDYVYVEGHDGYLHWLCCSNEAVDSRKILAFDLGSETFREIPLPHSILHYSRDNVLGVLSGKLCVMSWGEDVGCEVWVMEEYGVAESWVRRHVFSQFINDSYPYGFTSRSQFVIEDNDRLLLYNLSANEQKILEEHCPRERSAHKIVEYVDSLVWVAPSEL